jgi:hypothetical protein
MSVKRVAAGIAAAAAISGSVLAGATITAGSAGADPWKCESGNNCWWAPGVPGPGWGDVPGWGNIPNWQNAFPWGHLPEGWH